MRRVDPDLDTDISLFLENYDTNLNEKIQAFDGTSAGVVKSRSRSDFNVMSLNVWIYIAKTAQSWCFWTLDEV